MYIHRTKWAFGWDVPRNTYLEINLKMITIGIFLTQFYTEFQDERKTEYQNVPPKSWEDTLILRWTQRAITLRAPLLVVTPIVVFASLTSLSRRGAAWEPHSYCPIVLAQPGKCLSCPDVFPLTVGKAESVFHGYRKDPSCLSLNWNLAFSQ